MQKLSEGCLASLGRQGLIYLASILIGGPLACGCIALITLVIVPAVERLGPNNQLAAISVIFLVMITGLMGGVVLLWWLVNRGRAARLDAAFVPLGLKGMPYLLNGRAYFGQVRGRELEVYFYRGPTVEVRLHASAQTRVHVGEKSAVSPTLQRMFGVGTAVDMAQYPDWAIFALDSDWTQAWLADPRVQAALPVLMGQGAQWALLRSVQVQPGEVVLHLYRNRQLFAYPIAAQDARAWVDALQALAQVAESLPVPAVTAAPGGQNRATRMKINTSLNVIILGMLIGFPLCAGAAFLAAILIR